MLNIELTLENILLIDLNGFSFLSYLIILNMSIVWIVLILILFSKINARLALIYIKKLLKKTLNLKICELSIGFISFGIHFKQVSFYIDDLFHVKCADLAIQFAPKCLNKKNMKQLFHIKCKTFTLTICSPTQIQDENTKWRKFLSDKSIQKVIDFFLDNFLFEFINLKVFLSTTSADYLLNLNMNRLAFAFKTDFRAANIENEEFLSSSVNLTKSLLIKMKKLTVNLQNFNKIAYPLLLSDELTIQLFQGKSLGYSMRSHDSEFKASLLVDVCTESNLEFNIDLWNELFLKFLATQYAQLKYDPQSTIIVRLKLGETKFLFKNSTDILCQFKTLPFSFFELAHTFNTNETFGHFYLNSSTLHTFTNNTKTLLKLRRTKLIVKKIKYSLKITAEMDKNFKLNLMNISSNLNTLLLIYNRIESLSTKLTKWKKFQINLMGSILQFEINFYLNSQNLTDKIQLCIKQIHFKYLSEPNSSLLIHLNNNSLTNNVDQNLNSDLKFFCEKICFESIQNASGSDTKQQLLISPVLFGENFLSDDNQYDGFESDSFLTFNLIYVTVIQIRIQTFYETNGMNCYAKQFEVTIGDIFGSIDFEHFVCLSQFVSTLINIYLNEANLNTILLCFRSNLTSPTSFYVASRLLTSLVHLNLFELHLPLNSSSNYKDINSLVLNMVLGPLNYAGCNFHAPQFFWPFDFNISLLCNQLIDDKDEWKARQKNTLNLIECGYIKITKYNEIGSTDDYSSSYSVNLDNIKLCDTETKRLWFLWNEDLSESCACFGNCEFFSLHNLKLNASVTDETKFIYKPSIYWLNKNNRQPIGFGQSLLVPNEMCFYNWRKFSLEMEKNLEQSSKFSNFKVISHLESNELDLSRKFEPYEIGIYVNDQLTTFINDNIDDNELNTYSYEILTSNFNSANMSPPYFSDQFQFYIRYLPAYRTNNSCSDIADFTLTDKRLKELNLFDIKLLKDSESFKQCTKSNHSLLMAPNKIDSNLSVANLSLNKNNLEIEKETISNCESMSQQFSFTSHISLLENNSSDNIFDYKWLEKFTYNLNQIYAGYKLTKSNTDPKENRKLSIQHLRIESLIRMVSINEINEIKKSNVNILITPLSVNCISLVWNQLNSYTLQDDSIGLFKNMIQHVSCFKLSNINIKLINDNIRKLVSLHIDELSLKLNQNECKLSNLIIHKQFKSEKLDETWLNDFFDSFYPLNMNEFKFNLEIENLILLNLIENSLEKLLLPRTQLSVAHSINKLTSIVCQIKDLTHSLPLAALLDSFHLIKSHATRQASDSISSKHKNQIIYTVELILLEFHLKCVLTNQNYFTFESDLIRFIYSNNSFKNASKTSFKFNSSKCKLNFFLARKEHHSQHMCILSSEFQLDKSLLDGHVSGELRVNSLLNQTNIYMYDLVLPLLVDFSVNVKSDETLDCKLPGFMLTISQNQLHMDLNNIFLMIEVTSAQLKLSRQTNMTDFSCDSLRIIKSLNKQQIKVFDLFQHFLIDSIQNFVYNLIYSFKLNAKKMDISYFSSGSLFENEWYLLKIKKFTFIFNFCQLNAVSHDIELRFGFKKADSYSDKNESDCKIKGDFVLLLVSLSQPNEPSINKLRLNFNLRECMDVAGLGKLGSFAYRIKPILKYSPMNEATYNAELRLSIFADLTWSLDGLDKFYGKFQVNTELLELSYNELIKDKPNLKYSLEFINTFRKHQEEYISEEDEEIEIEANKKDSNFCFFYDFNGNQLRADKTYLSVLLETNASQLLSLMHRSLLDEHDEQGKYISKIKIIYFLLIGLIKRNNNTTTT